MGEALLRSTIAVGLSIGVGAMMPAATSLFSAFLIGAASGAMSSAITAAVMGNPINNQALLMGALIGGVSSMAMYGLQQSAMKDAEKNLQAGFARMKKEVGDVGVNPGPDGKLPASQETVDIYNEAYFKNVKVKDETRMNFAGERTSTRDAFGNVERWQGFTHNSKINGKWQVDIYTAAFDSEYDLWVTMGEEYIHVTHPSLGLNSTKWTEKVARDWEKNVYTNTDINHTLPKHLVNANINKVPLLYHIDYKFYDIPTTSPFPLP